MPLRALSASPSVKIAYLMTRAHPLGGVQIHVRDLAAALRAQDHSPTVITSGSGPFIDDLRARQIPTVILKHLTYPIRPIQDLRALREIREVLGDLRPDVLAVHSAKAGILGRLAGRSLRIPVVLTAHGWTFGPGIPIVQAAVYRQVERLVGPFTTKIIAVSEFDRQLGLEAGIVGEDRLVTVHNGMPDVPPLLRADPGRAPVRLVMVARFGPQKDHPTLFRALAGLNHHAWELDLIGDGPLMAQTKSLAEALGIGARVHFLGERLDVDQILARTQVGLLVSNWEGFPLSILEAMRAGLPVVASAVGGSEESVRDGETGFLVPRGDVETLRERLARLLTDPELRVRLGTHGRTFYEQHFTLGQFVAKTLAVYESMLATRKQNSNWGPSEGRERRTGS
jgi:glycosyltransferase involved in cell wall biosynthesis